MSERRWDDRALTNRTNELSDLLHVRDPMGQFLQSTLPTRSITMKQQSTTMGRDIGVNVPQSFPFSGKCAREQPIEGGIMDG